MAQVKHTNRLIESTSPYLLQHAHNPVDWRPWGKEALELARREDKPIFLSIGYSSCHWCHVMERESFEDDETARVLNEHFVPIKVDREERPDLDEIYMAAVQLIAGGGGWPLNVFLTPDLKPFYGGTYFPPEDRLGKPGFRRLLATVVNAYRTRRDKVEKGGNEVIAAIRRATTLPPANGAQLWPRPIEAAMRDLRGTFDAEWGGFSDAPKFPHATILRLLLAHHQRTGDPDALRMATVTLDRMARGGFYDQLGGGFHRYSVDRRWVVPHFEKMLYDNALLAATYIEAYQLTGRPLYGRVARETLDYLLRELAADDGGFCSAQDADTDGEEGRYYVWRPDEVEMVLGADDGDRFCRYYDVTKDGHVDGRSVLNVPVPPDEFAARFDMTAPVWEWRLERLREAVLKARSQRKAPAVDTKRLADWNGLAVSALARGYEVLGDERYRQAAEGAARFILTRMVGEEGLLHVYAAGRSHTPAYLDDYAYLLAGLVDLYEATLDPAWVREARAVADQMIARFWDKAGGGFYQTPEGLEDLVTRIKRGYDGALPNSAGVAARALQVLAQLTGRRDFFGRAETTLKVFHREMERAPTQAASLLLALDFYLGPVLEIVVVGREDALDTRGLLEAVRRRFLPRRVVAWIDPKSPQAAEYAETIPLVRDRPMADGQALAYVCENSTCRMPAASVPELEKLLPVR